MSVLHESKLYLLQPPWRLLYLELRVSHQPRPWLPSQQGLGTTGFLLPGPLGLVVLGILTMEMC